MQRVVRVLPDGPVDKAFDYLVPDALGGQVRVGTQVRVPLHGRRVRGWVVADGVEPPGGVTLRPLAKVVGHGPPADLVDLAGWAAWRWAGRREAFLGTASPPVGVLALPRPSAPVAPAAPVDDDGLAEAALSVPGGRAVVRLAPAADPLGIVLAACRRGHALVVCPSADMARGVRARLGRAGVTAALYPRDWAQGAAGATVVGARAAAWAPVGALAAVVVLDEHDESLQEQRSPTWHARDVAVERARRAGVPCVLASPCPTLEALAWGHLFTPSRATERAGWPLVDVVDMRRLDDPARAGLYSDALVRALRGGGRVVCVLNRTGRARLLACGNCRELVRCEACGAAVGQVGDALVCRRCATARPLVCLRCGSTRLRALALGVSRVRDELAALAGEDVVEVTAATADPVPASRLYVGTEAVLHRVEAADTVAFLELDQEMLAPRYRANEQALALLARAARLVGGRRDGGRVLVQTRLARHEVLDAALLADPGRLARAEHGRRRALRFPPHTALASVSGPGAEAFIGALGSPGGVEVLGPAAGRWLLRAGDHQALCDALAHTGRPPQRVRIEVDPLRL